MAAAVPVLYCETTAPEFSEPFPGSSEHVLYSRRDLILLGGFRFGQRDYGEPGHAVGRNGEPVERWSTRSNTHLRHSDILDGFTCRPGDRRPAETRIVAGSSPTRVTRGRHRDPIDTCP